MAGRPGAAVPVQDQADAASVAVPTAQAFLAEVAATPKRVPPPAGVGRLRKPLANATRWLTGALAPDTALGPTTSGWWTPRRSSAAGRGKPRAAQTWPVAPAHFSIQYAEKTTCMSLDLASWKPERSSGEVTARSRRSADDQVCCSGDGVPPCAK